MSRSLAKESLTVVARVDGAQRLSEVRAALQRIADDHVSERDPRPRLFADPKLGIHFARLVLLEEPSEAAHGSSVIFESNFDTEVADPEGARCEHLGLLCDGIFEALLSVFRACLGFRA